MNELAKHIEVLLLENDCVILPGFGGFIAHHTNASRIEAEELFLPPTRTIGFNTQLKLNDGLLVQSYMKTYDTDFADAFKRIDIAIEELKELLNKNGEVEIHGVGILTLDIHNVYEFRPNENGLLTPNLYGLSSFTISELANTVKEKKKSSPQPHSSKEIYEIKISRAFIRHTAAAAAAIIAFFFLSVPVENTYVEEENYATLDTGGIFESIRTRSLATSILPVHTEKQGPQQVVTTARKTATKPARKSLKPVSVRTEKVLPRETKTDETRNNIKKTEIPATSSTKTSPEIQKKPEVLNSSDYNVIVGSVTTLKDAQRMVHELKAKGYSSAAVIQGNGKIRISLMSFSNQTDAYKKINHLKEDGAFKDAWVLSAK